jgi:ParB/RepB/Spo0J family partition protein
MTLVSSTALTKGTGRRRQVSDLEAMRANFGRGPVTTAQPRDEEIPEHGAVRLIDIDQLVPDDQQPRKTVGKLSLAELRSEMKNRGLLTALTVTPIHDTRPLKFRIMAGERRYSALWWLAVEEHEHRFRRVPCVISHLPRMEQLFAQLSENMLREGLTPVETGEHLRVIKEEWGLTNAQVAEKLGCCTEEWVAQRLRIIENLTVDARSYLIDWQRAAAQDDRAPTDLAVERGPSFSLLREVAYVQPERQLDMLRQVAEQGLTVRDVKSIIDSLAATANSAGEGRRRGRPIKQFVVRPSEEISLAVTSRPITIHTIKAAPTLACASISVRNTNLVELVRATEKRGWQVDPDQYLEALDAAYAEDRQALKRLTAGHQPDPGGNS